MVLPPSGLAMESKNAIFQKLKPPCVALSQAALALNGSRGDIKAVSDQLETLKFILGFVTSKTNALDAKLAEYVFFPISQVLKASQKVSIRILELCLQCVAILIDQGWRKKMPPQLVAQMLILCSLLAEKKPKGLAFAESTDELQASAFWCLYHLFSIIETSSETAKLLTSESSFPQLGQTISVILDGIEGGGSVEVQIVATNALEALMSNVMDREIQAGFLPGIVSTLTRVLTPQTKSRRNQRVLIGCLGILEALLRDTMSDSQPSQSVSRVESSTNQNVQHDAKSIINETWQEQAASQLQPALTNIMKLRSHSRDDVQDTLGRLCLMLLQSCHKTLANCSILALETLIKISAARPDQATNTELEMLIVTDSTISALLETILYDWLQSLTTIMQSSDEKVKTLKMQQITMAYELLLKAGIDTSTVDRMLATTLRDSVVVTLNVPGMKQQNTPLTERILSLDLGVLNYGAGSMEFGSPLIRLKGQEGAMRSIEQFANLISSSTSSFSFAADIARYLRQSYGEAQIANFWLLLTATQTALQQKHNVDDLLNFESKSDSACNEHLEELYSFSLSILTEFSDQEADPRLKELALRTLALRAQTAGRDFRYELVDALYPVLHTLATPDENLQRDSITALNIFASACGYSSVSDLVVENVDYLTNAVALKLNAFDVSPQAPQVLLMMVRLAGSSLLPYLEDTVESIFAALEDFHGYPLLVELLFKVLGVIAQEGVQAPQLAITIGEAAEINSMLLETWQPTHMAELATLLQEHAQQEPEWNQTDDKECESHPERPWKDVEEVQDGETEIGTDVEQDQQLDDSEPPPPAPKTYNLLFKITELTQHFLPSASPSLRGSLLSLIRTTVPAIALHENSFLPLINTLWPEVVSRLDDDEPFILSTALEVIRLFCEHASDFMRTRITQLWPRLEEIHNATRREIAQSNLHPASASATSILPSSSLLQSGRLMKQALPRTQVSTGHYGDTSAQILWSSLVGCLVAILRFVQIAPEVVDQALAMLEPVLGQDEVQLAFVAENSDALWLAQIRSGAVAKPDMPTMADNFHWRFSEVSG